MKKLDEIKEMVKDAQQRWGEIRDLSCLYPLSSAGLYDKREKLKNLIEDIRENIEAFLTSCSPIRVEDCKSVKGVLESIFGISEGLCVSYVFGGYNESYFISDTINIVDGLAKRKNWAGGISFSFFLFIFN